MTDNEQPGKTGDFPRGKLNEHDEGGLRIAVGIHKDTVMIDFGTSVKWIGLDKQTAIDLGNSILEKAFRL